MFARLKLLMGLLHVLNLQTLNSYWRNIKFIFSVTLYIITSRNKKLNFAGDRLHFYHTNSLESRSFLGLCIQDPHLDFALDPLGPHERRPPGPLPTTCTTGVPPTSNPVLYSQSVLNRIGLEFLYESGSLFYYVRNVKMTKGRKGQTTTVLVFSICWNKAWYCAYR